MLGVAGSIDAGRCTVRKVIGTGLGAHTLRAHLAGRARRLAVPAMARITSRIHAHAVAPRERLTAGRLTAAAFATGEGAAGLGASVPARPAILRVAVDVDANVAARLVRLAAEEIAVILVANGA